MIKIENTIGPSPEQWRAVIQGARNPKNSWDRSDSSYEKVVYNEELGCLESLPEFTLGEADRKLLSRLVAAGPEHGKFARMLPVWVDITAPIYWFAELDTYKVGATRNSCSFMHKGTSKPFELSDFGDEPDGNSGWWNFTIAHLNQLRESFLEAKDETIFQELRRCVPQGYLQRATFQFNYQTLRNIYFQRRNHRLPEWHTFCEWIESLPYAEELITVEEKK